MRSGAADSPASTSLWAMVEGAPTPTASGTKRSTSSPIRAGSTSYRGFKQRGAFGRRLQRLRQRRARSAGWRSARGRSAAPPMRKPKRPCLLSGSPASGGRLAGVITSTTPGCALAASTSRCVTRPRAIVLTAHDGIQHAVGMVVGGIGCAPGDLEDAVAAGQRLARVRAVAQVRPGLVAMGLRHIEGRSGNGGEGRSRQGRQALRRSRRGERKRAHDDPFREFDLEGVVAGGRRVGQRRFGRAGEGLSRPHGAGQRRFGRSRRAMASRRRRPGRCGRCGSCRRRSRSAAAAETTAKAKEVRSRSFR